MLLIFIQYLWVKLYCNFFRHNKRRLIFVGNSLNFPLVHLMDKDCTVGLKSPADQQVEPELLTYMSEARI